TGHPSVAILLGGRRRDLNWLCCLRPFHEEVETLVLFFRQTSVCDIAPVKLTPVVGRLENLSVRLISMSPRCHILAEPRHNQAVLGGICLDWQVRGGMRRPMSAISHLRH